jgi:hypothetical protein
LKNQGKVLIPLAAVILGVILIAPVLMNTDWPYAAYAKVSHHKTSQSGPTSNGSSPNNNTVPLSLPILNNSSSSGNNTANMPPTGSANLPSPPGLNSLQPQGSKSNNASQTSPGLTNLIKLPGGLKPPFNLTNAQPPPTNTTGPTGPIIKIPGGLKPPFNLTNAPPIQPPTNTTGNPPPTNTTGNPPPTNTTGNPPPTNNNTNTSNNTNTNKNTNNNTNVNTNKNTNVNTNTNTNVNTNTNTIINQNTIKNTVKITNEINNIIKTQQATTTTTVSPTKQGPLVELDTLRLGKSSFPSGGIRPLADVSPFQIIGGHVSINSPSNNVNVIVAEITDTGVQHAVILDLKKTAAGIPGETLYHTDLGQVITGTNPFTGKVDTISHITDLLLYNNSLGSIAFNDDSQITLTIIFR